MSPRPVLALDLGATQIRAAVVLPDGSRSCRVARATPVSGGPAAIIDAAGAALDQARTADRAAPLAVALAAPGPLDPWAGVLVSPPNLGPAFHGFPIARELERRMGLPVFLERDTNVAALGEMAYGAAKGVRDFVYLTVSTGFGGAIVSRGELLLGPDGMAGEIGHLQVDLDGPRCLCGGIGHAESICSGGALAREAVAATDAGRSAFLAQLQATGAPLDAAAVAAGEQAGDRTCRALMQRARDAFAAAVVGVVNAFNPALIVVGGGIAEAEGERLLDAGRAAVATGTFPVPGRRVRIVPAALGADVALAGAQPLVQARFNERSWRGGGPRRIPAASLF